MLKVMLHLMFAPSERTSLFQYKHIESVSVSGDGLIIRQLQMFILVNVKYVGNRPNPVVKFNNWKIKSPIVSIFVVL